MKIDSIDGPFGNEWKFKSIEDFEANHDQYWGQYQMNVQGCKEGDCDLEFYKPEMEPLWKMFIVNAEVGTWAIIASYEKDFSKFYIQ